MLRREFLGKILPQQHTSTVTTSLIEYSGSWTRKEAGHLVRRACAVVTKEKIDQAESLGLSNSVDTLFQTIPLPDYPIHYDQSPMGQEWHNQPYNGSLNGGRIRSIQAWMIKNLIEEPFTIRESLTNFWNNHFACTANDDDRRVFVKILTLYRENAWGNFKQLVKDVTIEPCMLRFLNGNKNKLGEPNENYARELLELFTIGKGPQIGPGDYTNYTETDISEIAKILTGWKDYGVESGSIPEVSSVFEASDHDTSTKTLSSKFSGAVITNQGDTEYAHLIDIIFQQNECARFIMRKLYKWFVYYTITPDVETDIIQPLADDLVADNYEIKEPLKKLLKSEHFFDIAHRGALITSGTECFVKFIKSLRTELPDPANTENYWNLMRQLYKHESPDFNHALLEQPSVAGHDAYHQEPLLRRLFYTTFTAQKRFDFVDQKLWYFKFYNGGPGSRAYLKFVSFFEDIATTAPQDPTYVVTDFANYLFPRELHTDQITELKDILTDSGPDYQWSNRYYDYLSGNPGAIKNKISDLLKLMCKMPEFHLK